jgi:hypothetical protein
MLTSLHGHADIVPMILCEIRGGGSGNGIDMFSILLGFPLFIIIPPFLYTPLLPVPVTCTIALNMQHIIISSAIKFVVSFLVLQSKKFKLVDRYQYFGANL